MNAATRFPDLELMAHKCWRIISFYRDELEEMYLSWKVLARNVGSAHEAAYRTHLRALEESAERRALIHSLVFGVLTAAVGGYVFGSLAENVAKGALGKTDLMD